MDFDEMQVIWDTQNNRPLYAVDEAALHTNIKRRSRKFRKLVVLTRAVIMTTWAVLAAIYVIDPLLSGQGYHRLASGAILAAMLVGQTAAILRRRAGGSRFDGSIRGDLDRAVWQIDGHISWARNLRRWYVLPFVVAVSLDFAVDLNPRVVLVWFAMVALMAFASWAIDWEIRSLYLPKKRQFDEIRRKLDEEDRPHH